MTTLHPPGEDHLTAPYDVRSQPADSTLPSEFNTPPVTLRNSQRCPKRSFRYESVCTPRGVQEDTPDIQAIARIRAGEWETEEFWTVRISGYLGREHHPRQALMERVMYVAYEAGVLAGFIAGHLTRRYDCDGELQWITVGPGYRGRGVVSELIRLLAEWSLSHHASRVCVNVDPANTIARRFYTRHGAAPLNEHWLVWNDISDVFDPQSGR